MVRASISPVTTDPQTSNNFTAISETINGRLDVDNMTFQVIEGTTASTPDTQRLFKHSLSPAPHAWFPLVGDVYVEEMNGQTLDIRSTKQNVAFKLIAISGRTLATASVRQPDNYRDTIGVVQSNLIQGTGLIQCVTYNGQAAFHALEAAVIKNGYIYFTHNDTAASSTDEVINRINMTTGTYELLDPSISVPLCAMYYNPVDGYLYVAQNTTNSTVNVYKVDLGNFSINATIACGSGGTNQMGDIAVLYVDSSGNIYLGGRAQPATTGANFAKLLKFNSSGTLQGAVSNNINTANGSTSGYKKLIATTDYFYVTCGDGTLASEDMIISKISRSGFTLTSTLTVSDTNGVRGFSAVLVDNKIYIPCGGTIGAPAIQTAGSVGYAAFLAIVDTDTDLITKVPFAPVSSGFTVINGAFDGRSIMHYNGYVMWCGLNNQYTDLYLYEIATGQITSGAVMFGHVTGSSATAMDNILIPDDDGYPTILKNGQQASIVGNSSWCQPIL